MEFNIELYKKAGLNKNDIARLFGVSRTTVHNWHSGKTVHSLLAKKVQKVTSAVDSALEDNAFPVDVRAVSERSKEITKVLNNYL